MKESKEKCITENTEAYIVGNGTASLASALYLIKHTKLPPSRVHIFDKHASLEQGLHHKGDASSGYDQFAGCLPVPGGLPMKELLAMVPSAKLQQQSLLEEIQKAEASRPSAKEGSCTRFLTQKDGQMKYIPTRSLNLSFKDRVALVCFLLKQEKSLMKSQVQDLFRREFFESPFWAIWSVQCV